MSAFEMTALTNVVLKTTGGGTPERDNPEFWNGGIPWASVKDFKDGVHRLETTQEQISEKGLKRSASHLIPPGTPIICTRMAVGRIATAIMPVAINQDLRALHIRPDFNTDYVVCAVNSIREQIENLSIGSTVKGISIDQLLAFEIGAPALPEQTKIAEILTTVDRAIEQTEALIAKQQRLKTGLMQDLLTRGIDAHGNLRSESTHPFKDSPLGRIPAEWEANSIDEMLQTGVISDVQDGNHGELHPKSRDFVSDGIPFVMASDIADGVIDLERTKKITPEQYHRLRIGFSKPGDVLLSHKASIGFVALVPEFLQEVMLTPQVTYYRIGDREKLTSGFLAQTFRGPAFQSQLKNLAKQSTRDYIGILAQRKLLISMPCNADEQLAICRILEAQDVDIVKSHTTLAKLRALKTALMQDLLTGRKRVTALL